MKLTKLIITNLLAFVTVLGIAQTLHQNPPQDPIINFRVPLSKTSQIIYAIRYSQMLDAKTANELADLLVSQANDTTLNRLMIPPTTKPEEGKPKHK
jgi:hypothetical protein